MGLSIHIHSQVKWHRSRPGFLWFRSATAETPILENLWSFSRDDGWNFPLSTYTRRSDVIESVLSLYVLLENLENQGWKSNVVRASMLPSMLLSSVYYHVFQLVFDITNLWCLMRCTGSKGNISPLQIYIVNNVTLVKQLIGAAAIKILNNRRRWSYEWWQHVSRQLDSSTQPSNARGALQQVFMVQDHPHVINNPQSHFSYYSSPNTSQTVGDVENVSLRSIKQL